MDLPRFDVLPRHVAVIMDGNGRWAKARGLERSAGHVEGAKNFRRIGEYAGDLGIEYITFYAFSTENWLRPQKEVGALMHLFADYLAEARDRLEESRERGVRMRFLGDRSALAPELAALMDTVEEATAKNSRVNLNVAVNYGGRQELLRAVRQIADEVKAGSLQPEEIGLETVEDRLYTAGQPPVDLLIRPSGEQRLSNFLLWQCAYAEFWYSDVLWPDFTPEHFNEALRAYEKRNRRFGKV